MAARARFSRGRPFKPASNWAAVTSVGHVATAAATKIIMGSFVVGEQFTLRRTRGLFGVAPDQLAQSERTIGAFGLCVVSGDAFAAGAASIPGPFTDDESDLWVVHQYVYSSLVFGDATGFQLLNTNFDIDSKGMRKITEEERLVVMVENGSATFGMNWWMGVRVLVTGSRG